MDVLAAFVAASIAIASLHGLGVIGVGDDPVPYCIPLGSSVLLSILYGLFSLGKALDK